MLGQRLDYFLDGLNENTKNSNNLFKECNLLIFLPNQQKTDTTNNQN